MTDGIEIGREQILAYRLWVNGLLGNRLSLHQLVSAARPGLQDGAPRSAVLSLAARVENVEPDDWRAPGLSQVFGPRGAIYVVPTVDVPVFTRGLLPRDPTRLAELERIAARAQAVLGGKPMRQRELDAALPEGNRELRWAACLGTLLPVWDTVDTIIHPGAEPDTDPEDARHKLARRFFRYLGPATVLDLQRWIAANRRDAHTTVAALGDDLTPVTHDGTELLALSTTLSHLIEAPLPIDPDLVHLLPPDDTYISRGTRDALLPDPGRRDLLWPKAPPPGALVIGGEVAGTWRRRGGEIAITAWHEISDRHVDRAEEIATSWPLGEDPVAVSWTVRS